MNNPVDPPLESKNWGQDEWQMQVERQIGPWIDAMLQVEISDPRRNKIENHEVAHRRGTAESLRACGLEVTGEDADVQWNWSVGTTFDRSKYERLMDL